MEQLVEVPTIVSFSSLQRIAEQHVDIPVVGGSGAGGGLSGFLPGQHFSVTAEQIVDNPVPRPGDGSEVFKVYTVDRVQQRFRSTSPSPQIQVEVFKIFNQSRVPQRFLLDTLGKGFFGLFTGTKKFRRFAARWMKKCLGTSAHPRRRLMRFIMSCEMTSEYRS